MRRVVGWSIPLVLIVIRAAVAAGVQRRRRSELPADDPVVFSDYKADFTRQRRRRLDCGRDHHRRVPRRAARHLPVTGTSPTRTTRTCGRCPMSPRSCSTVQPVPYQMLWEDGKRFRVAKIGDPDEYLSYGTHVFEIRYTRPRRARPRRHRRRQEIRHIDRRRRHRAVGFLLERRRAVLEQPDRSGPTSRSTLPGDVTGAQCSVGFGVGAPCRRPDRQRQHRSRSRPPTWRPRTPVTLRAGVDVPTPAARRAAVALHLGPDPRPVADRAGVDPGADRGLRRLGGFLWYRTTVEPSPGLPAAVRAAAGARAGADRVHPHRGGPEERPHRDAVLSRRAQADRAASRSTTSTGESAASPSRPSGSGSIPSAARSASRSR